VHQGCPERDVNNLSLSPQLGPIKCGERVANGIKRVGHKIEALTTEPVGNEDHGGRTRRVRALSSAKRERFSCKVPDANETRSAVTDRATWTF
jgi:hypothetical protein